MVAPYNYILPQQQNPLEAAVSGLRLGATIEEIQAARQQRAMQQQAMEQQQRQAQALQAEVEGFYKDPSAERLMRIAPYMPKDAFGNLTSAFAKRDEAQQKSIMSVAQRGIAALQAKQPQVAADLFQTYADAATQSGDAEIAQTYKFAADLIKTSPETGMLTVGSMIAQLPGGKEMLEGIGAVRKEGRETAMFPDELERKKAEAKKARVEAAFAERAQQAGLDEKSWIIKNYRSQISDRASRLKLERDKFEQEIIDKAKDLEEKFGVLPPAAQESVNKAAIEAGVNKQQADNYLSLAQRLRKDVGTSWGALGSASEFLKRATGRQDAVSTARQEYARVRNQLVSKNLPPGAASDKDVEMLMNGFPPENASPAVLAEFLEAQARVSAAGAALENARADWLAQNRGSLARSKNTFIAGDYTVKPGETWPEFSARVAKDVQKKTLETLTGPGPAQIPKNVPPGGVPERSPNPVFDAADAILRGGR